MPSRHFSTAALLLALALPVLAEDKPPTEPAPASDAAWKTYSSTEGLFSVRFPVPPKEETRNGAKGSRVRFVSAQVPGQEFSVNYTDFPEGVKGIPAGNVIDGIRNHLVRATRGKLLEDRYVEIKPYQGREIRIETPDRATTLFRVYLVKNRLYQLRVLALAGQLHPEGAARFFDSFKLTAP